MKQNAPDPLWYKDAIIYQLHIKAFFDSNKDGIGDFAGLTSKLDYLQDLGVTALWLLPFYPSPLRDDGYDIADYEGVNPAYGTMRDFRTFVREAHRRGLKVITELVINHTSDQHRWFQRARRARPGSSQRDFYVWSDTDQKYQETRVIFLDTEKSNWAWDPEAQAYYWHRFYSHQPDLNFDNPAVLKSVLRVMRFWLDTGVDGLRLDAVPYLCEREGTNNENLPETHSILKRIRAAVDGSYQYKMLLAEANQWPEDVLPYFGEGHGDECHMAFHFPLMPRVFMAVAQEDRHPITDIMRQTPDIPQFAQWAIFLRNHDELTLEMVTDRERDYLWQFYARDPRMRLNLGIRRRLAPLMENDRRRIDLMLSLLLSMPGTPVLYYGDEIGMGDNVYLGDRDGVRTPMQWSPDRNGGFSLADPARLYLPPIQDPVYGYQAINVERQLVSSTSLLNHMRRMLALRRSIRAFGRGSLTFLYPRNRKILAYVRQYEDETILCVANLSRSAQAVELDLSSYKGLIPVEMLDRSIFPRVADRPYTLTLPGYGVLWFELSQPQDVAGGLAELEPEAMPEFVTLVVRAGWADLSAGRNVEQMTQEILPRFLPTQRWFGARDRRISQIRLAGSVDLPPPQSVPTIWDTADGWRLLLVEASFAEGPAQLYFIPLGFAWGPPTADSRLNRLPQTLAEVRRFRAEGALLDAMAQDNFVLGLVDAMRTGRVLPAPGGAGEVRFAATPAFAQAALPEEQAVTRLGAEQSNSSVLIGEYGVLKIYRRVQPGVHPEIEMLRYLTDSGKVGGIAPLLGTAEWISPDGAPMALVALTAFVRNQGDAWTYVLEHLKRGYEDSLHARAAETAPASAITVQDALFLSLAPQLGLRTAELHKALCPDDESDPAFRPEPITPEDLATWREGIRADAERVLQGLADWLKANEGGDPTTVDLVRRLLAARESVLNRIARSGHDGIQAMKTRYHGDLHLGQVLVAQKDVIIIDFEGEPQRPISDRRRKHTPLRDVAGVLRSFDYAQAAAVRSAAQLPAFDVAGFEGYCREWRDYSAKAFLTRYRETLGDTPVWPADPADGSALLELMVLEKAFYEIGYELANRPAWLSIPLRSVVELIEAQREEVLNGSHA